MSSCLSSRACGFDLEHMIKWPCSTITSSRTTSNSSSPSSTLSESSNSPNAISTRKPRTLRKRPNQTYNEAATLLSLACPNVFSTKHLTRKTINLPKFIKLHGNFFTESPELIENSAFLLRHRIMEKPCKFMEPKVVSTCRIAREIESNCVSMELNDVCFDDFDTESILDEEIEQGIDSIMGDSSNSIVENNELNDMNASDWSFPMGLGFGMRNGIRALRNDDERNWNFPMVEMEDITPVGQKKTATKKKKKKKKMEELMKLKEVNFNSRDEKLISGNGRRLGLKLNYDAVLEAWSDKESPVPEEMLQSASPGGDIHARAAEIDLFLDNDGWTESDATCSIDKTHSRVPFKKIKSFLKNSSLDRRPRCKGRFVTKQNSPTCDEET